MEMTELFDKYFGDLFDYENWVEILYTSSYGTIGLIMMLVFNIVHLTYYIQKNRSSVGLNYNLFETTLYSSFLTMAFGLLLWYIGLLKELAHFAFFVLELCISIGMMIYYKYQKV